MLNAYDRRGQKLSVAAGTGLGSLDAQTVWIDLITPTSEEEQLVETALGVSIPTRAEAREIEASSRLYRENGALYMTAFILYNIEQPNPSGATLTFVLTTDRLVTIRYHEPKAFPIYAGRAAKGEIECSSAAHIMAGLVETLIERTADLIERKQDELEQLAQHIFKGKGKERNYTRRLDVTLRSIGRQGDVTARLEESAFSLERLLTFLSTALRERGDTQVLARLETAQQDLRSLTEQMRFLTSRLTFLLDATLGAISIEQNQTMKVFSLLAVTLMPPTLVAGIYGMNFKHMPELEWVSGYPMALGLMLLAGLIPYLYARSKGWF